MSQLRLYREALLALAVFAAFLVVAIARLASPQVDVTGVASRYLTSKRRRYARLHFIEEKTHGVSCAQISNGTAVTAVGSPRRCSLIVPRINCMR